MSVDLQKGIKYLGFVLKPNGYGLKYWRWLTNKIERRIHFWCHRWFFRGGRLTLVKSVLEGMSVYWFLLAHIPKGVLEKIRRICFDFLWRGKNDRIGFHLEKWQLLTKPKLGGWGLKKIFSFGRSSVAKSLWNLISKEGLWKKILVQKYLAPDSLLDLTQNLVKNHKNASNHWKALVLDFPIIGNHLAW